MANLSPIQVFDWPTQGRVVSRCLLICCVVFTSLQVKAQENEAVLLFNVNIVDVNLGGLITDSAVLMENNRIVSIGQPAHMPLQQSVTRIDGGGGFLIPGLWDVHVHLSYSKESALPAFVANGVTYVRDTGSQLEEIESWRAQILTGDLTGPEILRAGPILNGREFNEYQLQVSSESEARMAVRTLHKIGVDFIKLHRRTSREAFFAIADETKKLNMTFAGHIPMSVSPLEASNAGQATIEHTETLFGGTFMTADTKDDFVSAVARWREESANELFEAFVRNGTAFSPTMIVWQELINALEAGGLDDPRQRYVSQQARTVAEGILENLEDDKETFLRERKEIQREFGKVVNAANQQGVTLLAGTDLAAGFVYPGFSLHDELIMLTEAGLSPLEALQAATTNPAGLFPALAAGTIEVGKRADMVLLKANPLQSIENIKQVKGVVLRGKFLDEGKLGELLEQSARFAAPN